MSQWSTPSSGPLARVGSLEKSVNQVKSWEPVAHFVEWTTSSAGNLGKGGNRVKSWEPVVHFVEWTTSSGRKPGKRQEPGQKLGASGPLC